MGDSQPAVMGVLYVDGTACERHQADHRNVAPYLKRTLALVRIALATTLRAEQWSRLPQVRKPDDLYAYICPSESAIDERLQICSMRAAWPFQWLATRLFPRLYHDVGGLIRVVLNEAISPPPGVVRPHRPDAQWRHTVRLLRPDL